MRALKGKSLSRGDIVGVVAPASGFNKSALEKGVAALTKLGYRVKSGRHLDARSGQYFAGTPQQRADDLHGMFADPEVRAVVCARGGYGSQDVLPLLDVELARKNPKPIVGCSDISALQLWLLGQCGLVALHGPMAAGDFARADGIDQLAWENCVFGCSQWALSQESGLTILRSGAASGLLWGGCLSMLVSTLATPWELMAPPEKDILLFIEDIGEKPYKIERMLRQWREAGKMRRVQGIIFGEMLECEQPASKYTLDEVLARIFEDFHGPIALGLRSGHVSRHNITLPLGVRARLDCAGHARLEILEAATIK